MVRLYRGFFIHVTAGPVPPTGSWSATAEVTGDQSPMRLPSLTSRTAGHETEASAVAAAYSLGQAAINVELELRSHTPRA
jgi:hypothetical protein